MNAHASPSVSSTQPHASLADLLDLLLPHGEKLLVLAGRDGWAVQAGYHITEVKAASFVTLDCGGNPDAWQETVLQVEDILGAGGSAPMSVGKFQAILGKVDGKLRLNRDARLTIELSRPDEAMQVFDLAGVDIEPDRAILRLAARPAICKPRHRVALEEAGSCCQPSEAKNACCA